jgi:hyperosmotically inducible protein
MKTLLKTTALAAVFASVLIVLPSGCASTPTRESTGQYIDDSAITAKVKTAFVRDPSVKALQIHVNTFQGVVQLSGFVDSQAEKARAAQVAEAVAGVRSVVNNITVKGS